jgi:hypothetical protein
MRMTLAALPEIAVWRQDAENICPWKSESNRKSEKFMNEKLH